MFIKKLAVLVIENLDGSRTTEVGEKGDIATKARDMIRAANDNGPGDVVRITAIGEAGVLKQRRWKGSQAIAAPSVEISEEAEPEDSGDVEDEATVPDADEIRAQLKAKGVKVPPRISVEKLVQMAEEAGIKV